MRSRGRERGNGRRAAFRWRESRGLISARQARVQENHLEEVDIVSADYLQTMGALDRGSTVRGEHMGESSNLLMRSSTMARPEPASVQPKHGSPVMDR